MSRMEIHPIFKFVNSEWFIPISSGKGRKKKFVEYSDQIKKFLPNSRDSFIPGFDPCCLLPVLAWCDGLKVQLDDLAGLFQPWWFHDSMEILWYKIAQGTALVCCLHLGVRETIPDIVYCEVCFIISWVTLYGIGFWACKQNLLHCNAYAGDLWGQ